MLKTATNQPHLRLVTREGRFEEPRRYAQSMSEFGQSDSHGTSPADSRSIATASVSEQERAPYATLRKCPAEVPQRSANAARSRKVLVFRNFNKGKRGWLMTSDYHHRVIEKQSPSGDFTNWCMPPDNLAVENEDAIVRTNNLKRLIDRDFDGNQSAFARAYKPESPKPQFFSELLKLGGEKSFGEKLARQIEDAIGLKRKQLDVPNSPLIYDEARLARMAQELHSLINELDPSSRRELLVVARKKLAGRGHRKTRAS